MWTLDLVVTIWPTREILLTENHHLPEKQETEGDHMTLKPNLSVNSKSNGSMISTEQENVKLSPAVDTKYMHQRTSHVNTKTKSTIDLHKTRSTNQVVAGHSSSPELGQYYTPLSSRVRQSVADPKTCDWRPGVNSVDLCGLLSDTDDDNIECGIIGECQGCERDFDFDKPAFLAKPSFLYKCLSCKDFTICSKCRHHNVHSHHSETLVELTFEAYKRTLNT